MVKVYHMLRLMEVSALKNQGRNLEPLWSNSPGIRDCDVASVEPGRGLCGRRVVVPHTTPDGLLVNFYGWAVGTAAQIPKATTTVMRVLSCAFASAM